MGRRKAAAVASTTASSSNQPLLVEPPSSRTGRRGRASSVSPRRGPRRRRRAADGSPYNANSEGSSSNNNNDDESKPSVTFPRRFPRLGNAFQLKSIPELSEANSFSSKRPAALKLSVQAPHCTEEQVSLAMAAAVEASKIESSQDEQLDINIVNGKFPAV